MKKILFSCMLIFLIPCFSFAVELMTEGELDDTSAREGVSIFLEGKITIEQEFSNLGIYDDDGLGTGSGTNGGWLISDSGGQISSVEISLKDALIEIDVATTGADGYDIIGDGEADIPGYTSFVRFGLPENIAVNFMMAPGHHLYLNNDYSTEGGAYLGEVRISDLAIQVNSTPTAMYIFPH